jgi:phospholipid/cholesterol/gamma-HCH transport system permease protein
MFHEDGAVDAVSDARSVRGQIHISHATEDTLLVRFSGSWTLQSERPTVAELQSQFDAGTRVQRLTFDTPGLDAWDSGLLTFLRNLEAFCQQRQIVIDRAGLPDGIRRLLDLAAAVPERSGTPRGEARDAILTRIGKGGARRRRGRDRDAGVH